jgi:hypothetical protein
MARSQPTPKPKQSPDNIQDIEWVAGRYRRMRALFAGFLPAARNLLTNPRVLLWCGAKADYKSATLAESE